MSGLDLNTYYGKISKKARVFNKLDPNQVKEGIEIAQADFNKTMRKPENVHLNQKESIEYVVKDKLIL